MKVFDMQKCEHGQKIVSFCVAECCQSKEGGGCYSCMKKYHNHLNSTAYVSEEEAIALIKKYDLNSARVKSRHLQELIFNYFSLLKNQFTTLVDAACLEIMNYLGHPYLVKQKLLATYKNIKKKNYKKIQQKDFKKFYDITNSQSKSQLSQKQSLIYLQKLNTNLIFINNLEKSMKVLEKLVQQNTSSNFNFSHDRNLSKKINETVQTIFNDEQKNFKNVQKNHFKFVELEENSYENINSKEKESLQKKIRSSLRKHDERGQLPSTFKKQENKKNQHKSHRISSLDKKLKQQTFQKFGKQQIQVDQMNLGKRSFEKIQQVKGKKNKEIEIMNREKNIQICGNIKNHQASSIESNSYESSNGKIIPTILPISQSKQKIFESTEITQKIYIIPIQNQMKDKMKQIQSPLLKNSLRFKNSMQKDEVAHFQKNKQFQISPIKIEASTSIDKEQKKSLDLLIKSIKAKTEEAIPYLQKSLQYAEDNLSSAQYLSYLYLEQDRPKDCLDLCNKFLENLLSYPEQKQFSLNLKINKIAALNNLGRYSQAIAVSEGWGGFHENEKLYKNLGDSYFSIGKYEKAIINYQKAIQLCKTFDEAYYNLAVCFFIQGSYFNAKYFLGQALIYSPQNKSYDELKKQITKLIDQL